MIYLEQRVTRWCHSDVVASGWSHSNQLMWLKHVHYLGGKLFNCLYAEGLVFSSHHIQFIIFKQTDCIHFVTPTKRFIINCISNILHKVIIGFNDFNHKIYSLRLFSLSEMFVLKKWSVCDHKGWDSTVNG